MGNGQTLKRQMFIADEWVDGLNGETFERRSPATGEAVAVMPRGRPADVDRAAQAARRARRRMASLSPFERGALCDGVASAIELRTQSVAEELSREQGKPVQEALGEVQFAAGLFRDAGEYIRRLETSLLPSADPNKRIMTIRQPHGAVGIITPWNYPVGIPSEYLSAALAAGNTIVWKPAPTTSSVAVSLLECMLEGGVPESAINLVFGEADVGSSLVSHPDIQAVGFTGSSTVGELVAKQAGAKPVLLELGGNGPTIILDDADLERAVEGTAFGCYSNAGQICQSSERILVTEATHKTVLDGLVEKARSIRLGDPLDPGTGMGPLNNDGVARKMDEHIEDAVAKGATVVTGGRRAAGQRTELFYEPTVIDGVTLASLLNRDETFGPVAPLITVSDLDEAIAVANSAEQGLCASVYTSSLSKAWHVAERLECGVVNVNETPAYWDGRTPFGGYSGKRSGVGRLGGSATILAMTQEKSLVMDVRL